jgi:hypothetical protein
VIWIILIIASVVCLIFVLVRLRSRAKRPVTWSHLIDQGRLSEVANTSELLKMFFLADAINPTAFLANHIEVFGLAATGQHEEAGKPTPSAVAFEKGVKAPPGYPNWFLAAYPDVVIWLATRDENAMLRFSAEAMYGAEGAKELIRIHGVKRIGELMDERFTEFDLAQLRRLVVGFSRDTGKRLECAMAAKKARTRRRWFDSKPRRTPASTFRERVISDFE